MGRWSPRELSSSWNRTGFTSCFASEATARTDCTRRPAGGTIRWLVVGIPKTVDNDIEFVWRTFGYSTAVEEAAHIIDSAHAEAKSVRNGVGLVRMSSTSTRATLSAAARRTKTMRCSGISLPVSQPMRRWPGRTDVVIGLWYNVFLHVPISMATERPRRVSAESEVWSAVLAATGQPATMVNQQSTVRPV